MKTSNNLKNYLADICIFALALLIGLALIYKLVPALNAFIFPRFFFMLLVLSMPIIALGSWIERNKKLPKSTMVALSIIVWLAAIIFPIKAQLYGLETIFSCSMYHKEKDFDKWWEENELRYKQYNITKEQFRNFPSPNGVAAAIEWPAKVAPENINMGDIIGYRCRGDSGQCKGYIISHRVISKAEGNGTNYFITMGDCNACGAELIPEEDFIFKFVPLSAISRFLIRDGCQDRKS